MNGESHDDIQYDENYWTIIQGKEDKHAHRIKIKNNDYEISYDDKKNSNRFRIVREIGG
jgi:hypothetical protein